MDLKLLVFLFTTLAVGQLTRVVVEVGARQQRLEYKTGARNLDISREKRLVHHQEDGSSGGSTGNNTIPDEHHHYKQNEIDDRITLGEPYKSLIQTTARIALAQTKITNHVNLDTAMSFLNDAGYFLSKPVVLLRVLKVLAVTLATFMATVFFFPGAHQFLDAAWRDPVNTLNLDRYLTSGLHERSVIAIIGSKTDETLSRVGLQDNSCRERSLCYLGEILKCSFPHTSETLTRFATDNFSNTGIREHLYARAFVSGFVDRNCSRVGANETAENHNCLGNFINSILVGVGEQSGRHNKVK